MSFEFNKSLNLIIISIMSLVLIITVILILKIADSRNPYSKGVNIHDTYAPYSSWEKAH